MKSIFARFNMSPTRLEVLLIIALSAICAVGLVGAGSSILTGTTSDNDATTMSAASDGSIAGPADGGTSPRGGGVGSRGGDGGAGSAGDEPSAAGSGPGATGSEPTSTGGEPSSVSNEPTSTGGEPGSGSGATSPSTTTPSRTVKVSMVVHRGQGDFSAVPNQPFRGVCQPDGIRREHEGGEPLWEAESGTVEFGVPLLLTFEVGAGQQVWCAFYLQPHERWERVTDVSTVVNSSPHSATNVECLIPATGESYRQTVEAVQYLPGRSDGCDVTYTIAH